MEPVKDNNLDYTMNILENALSLLLGADVAVNDMSFDVDTDEGTCDIRISADVDGDDLACDCDDDNDEEVCDGDCDNCVYADCDDDDVPCLGIPPIDNIIFNPPATIVLWCDGTKTVVKCMEGQKFERYAGFAAAVMKKLFGSSSHAKHVMEECTLEKDEPEKKPESKRVDEKPKTKANNFEANLNLDTIVKALLNIPRIADILEEEKDKE